MPFLLPNQQRQSTEGKTVGKNIQQFVFRYAEDKPQIYAKPFLRPSQPITQQVPQKTILNTAKADMHQYACKVQ